MRQAPMALRSISAGEGASSPPPASGGASITSRCGPTAPSTFMSFTHCRVTVLPIVCSFPGSRPEAGGHAVIGSDREVLQVVVADHAVDGRAVEAELVFAPRERLVR